MAQPTKPSRRPKAPAKRPTKPAPKRISDAKLLQLAAKHKPPQKWFEETDLPFTPSQD